MFSPVYGDRSSLLKQNRLVSALKSVEEILEWLETNGVAGIEHPLEVYLMCYWVLQANQQDPRTDDILRTGYQLLQERAANIRDEALRHSFLENVESYL
jgi:hypothetical protein